MLSLSGLSLGSQIEDINNNCKMKEIELLKAKIEYQDKVLNLIFTTLEEDKREKMCELPPEEVVQSVSSDWMPRTQIKEN